MIRRPPRSTRTYTLFPYTTLFRSLSTPEQAEIIETCGRLLIQRYWGRYIALIQAPDGLLALRDPGGMFPCHVVLDGGTLVLSSEPSLIAAAGFIKPEIDEIGLLRAISLGGLPEEATALCGVRSEERRVGKEWVSTFRSWWWGD